MGTLPCTLAHAHCALQELGFQRPGGEELAQTLSWAPWVAGWGAEVSNTESGPPLSWDPWVGDRGETSSP